MRNILHGLCVNRSKIRFVLFIVYCFFIIYYTILSRQVFDSHRADFRLMWAYREMLMGHSRWKEDVGYNLKNILFFIPFGMTFPEMSKLHFSFVLVNRRWLVVMLAGIMLSIFIEITQYVFLFRFV